MLKGRGIYGELLTGAKLSSSPGHTAQVIHPPFVPKFTDMVTTTQTTTLEYVQAPETAENLDWADLATLDLSKFDLPGGKEELAQELTRAISEVGMLPMELDVVPRPPPE